MKKLILSLLALFIALLSFAQGEKRIALVIGNSAYLYGGALANPVNDANLMATTLEGLGFTVIKKINANLRTMQIASTDFKSKLKDYDVALFFYAGHGIQVDGINYLVPVDATLDNRDMAKYDAFSINDINDAFMSNSQKTNIMILDACRNNPFRAWARGGERGFTKIENPSKGTIIAFATQPGETAADGDGSNGLYTSKLVQQMKMDQNIESVFKNTRKAVNEASGGKQVPQDWSSLMDEFYFNKPREEVTKRNVDNNNNESNFEQGEVVVDYGNISIDSEISGTFYIDGEQKGNIKANSKGNKLNKISTGNHTLKIEGKESWEKTITVSKDQTSYISAKSNKQVNSTIKTNDLPNQLFDSRDNKTYKTVKIGSQVLMAENLTYKPISGRYWAYDDNQSNVAKYGYLYDWKSTQNVCPVGWHLPSKQEFETLLQNASGAGINAYNEIIPSGKSGFSALLGGYHSGSGFHKIETDAHFWSSAPYRNGGAWNLILSSNKSNAIMDVGNLECGFSIRCFKDK